MLMMAFVSFSYAVVAFEAFTDIHTETMGYCSENAATLSGTQPYDNYSTLWCSWLEVFQVCQIEMLRIY